MSLTLAVRFTLPAGKITMSPSFVRLKSSLFIFRNIPARRFVGVKNFNLGSIFMDDSIVITVAFLDEHWTRESCR